MSAKDIQPYKGKRKALLQTLADPANMDLDTLSICELAKCSRESYYKYTKEPDFQSALKELSIALYVRHLPQSVNSVIRTGRRKDQSGLQANRTIQEACGIVGGKGGNVVNIANMQQPTHERKDYASPQEAMADIDKTIAELQAYKATLIQQQESNRFIDTHTSAQHNDSRKGHAIHPHTETTTNEGV